jgi:hypothetical protein
MKTLSPFTRRPSIDAGKPMPDKSHPTTAPLTAGGAARPKLLTPRQLCSTPSSRAPSSTGFSTPPPATSASKARSEPSPATALPPPSSVRAAWSSSTKTYSSPGSTMATPHHSHGKPSHCALQRSRHALPQQPTPPSVISIILAAGLCYVPPPPWVRRTRTRVSVQTTTDPGRRLLQLATSAVIAVGRSARDFSGQRMRRSPPPSAVARRPAPVDRSPCPRPGGRAVPGAPGQRPHGPAHRGSPPRPRQRHDLSPSVP